MPMLQIPITDKEYARLKIWAKKKGMSARSYAYYLIFQRLNRKTSFEPADIAEMRQMHNAGVSLSEIGDKYGIDRLKVYRLIKKGV